MRYALGLGIAFALGNAAVAMAADPAWDQLTQAAKKEGTVTLYAINGNSDCLPKNLVAFTQQTGIKVETFFGRGTEISQRIGAETASGHVIADVMWNGPPAAYNFARNGVAGKLGPLPNRANLLDGLTSDEFEVPSLVDRQGMLVNTNLVKPETELKSWFDLLNPKWHGQIMADTFYIVGQGSNLFDATYNAPPLGPKWHEGLAKQDIRFNRDLVVNVNRVAQGEAPIYLPLAAQYATQIAGLPIRLWIPEEGAPYYSDFMEVLAKAPHPNAGRMLINYLLDPAPQLACANSGIGPSVKGVLDKVRPEMRALETSKLLNDGKADPDHVQAMVVAAKALYAK